MLIAEEFALLAWKGCDTNSDRLKFFRSAGGFFNEFTLCNLHPSPRCFRWKVEEFGTSALEETLLEHFWRTILERL